MLKTSKSFDRNLLNLQISIIIKDFSTMNIAGIGLYLFF